MLFKIKSRWTGAMLFEVEIECRSDASDRVKLGKAVLAAMEKLLNLRDANLQGADLRDANLQGAYLRDANLQGANLQGAYLRDANLQGADLRGAYLQGAYLRGADLRGADLRGAYLQGAGLQGAYLQGAYLRGADLQGADLRDANLRGAYLQGADLQGAYLQGAVAKVESLVARVIRSDGYEFFGFRLEDGSLHIAAGCQSRTVPGYRKHIVTDYPGTSKAAETTDILDFIEKRFAAMPKM